MTSSHSPSSSNPSSKSRNPWPIVIIAYFIVFISGVVTFAIFASRQKVELVRPDYYADEIQFQQQLDRLNRTQPINASVTIVYNSDQQTITVTLPAAHAQHPTSGQIHLYRPSDAHLDQDLALALDAEGVQHVNAKNLRPGLWKVRVQWTADGQDYFFAQTVIIGHHPGGMVDNSPTFQRWEFDRQWIQVPKGRLTVPSVSAVPSGLPTRRATAPNVETLGYYRKSLRDTNLAVFGECEWDQS